MKQLTDYTKKILPKILLYALSVFLIYKFVILPFDFKAFKPILENLKPLYMLTGVCCAAFMLFAETFTMRRYLKLLKVKVNFKQCMVFTAVGNFFSSVTPAATGGQPMQLYYMHKNKISTSKGTLALLMDLGAYQTAIAIMAALGYGIYFKEINTRLGRLLPVFWLGFFMNTALMALIFTAIFNPDLIYKIIDKVAAFIGFFSLNRKISFLRNATQWAKNYRTSSYVIRKNKKVYIENIIITVFRIIAMHSAPFWIYKALGFTGYSFFHILLLQSVLYISCAALPLPGGMGIGERMFLLYFAGVFPLKTLNLACILSRGVGFYSVVLLCGVVIAAISFISYTKLRNIKRLYRIGNIQPLSK